MFDPYHKWLGIPPKDQPPNHYRLLGLSLFESDPEVIDAAANRQMAYVQQRAMGEHAPESQKLLNELSAARVCLLDAKKKAAYDAEIKAKTSLRPTVVPQPTVVSPPTMMPSSPAAPAKVARSFSEEHEEALRQSQEAIAGRSFEKAIELLSGHNVDDDDPRLQKLLNAAKLAIARLQDLSQQLDDVWAQQDAERISQIANDILRIQPSHPAALEALRWVEELNRIPLEFAPPRAGRRKTGGERIPRRYLGWAAVVLVVACVFAAVSRTNGPATRERRSAASTEEFPQPAEATPPEVATRTGTSIPTPTTKRDVPVVNPPQPEWKPAVYNVTIDPPEAVLSVKDNKGDIAGLIVDSGGRRQIRINEHPAGGAVVVKAVCPRYKPWEQRLTPKAGQNDSLQIRLDELPEMAKADEAQAPAKDDDDDDDDDDESDISDDAPDVPFSAEMRKDGDSNTASEADAPAGLQFDGFSDVSSLTLNGAAKPLVTKVDGNVLCLTPDAPFGPGAPGATGSAFSNAKFKVSRFSTSFSFRIAKSSKFGADGFAFVLQPTSPSSLGTGGGNLGYGRLTPSVIVEFDANANPELHDPSDSHIAVTINGISNHMRNPYFTNVRQKLSNGRKWYAWIDYNGANLGVWINDQARRPTNPKIVCPINIPHVLGQDTAYVGFTSATGLAKEFHAITSWQYNESLPDAPNDKKP